MVPPADVAATSAVTWQLVPRVPRGTTQVVTRGRANDCLIRCRPRGSVSLVDRGILAAVKDEFTPPQPLPLSELNQTELITYMIESQEQFNINQKKFNMNIQPEISRLWEMLSLSDSNQDPPVDLYYSEGSDEEDIEIDSLTMEPLDTLLMGDEDPSTNPARETDEFIKSSANDLVPIPRESEVTSGNNLECDTPDTIPLPTTNVREENFDIHSPLGEHVVDFLMENEDRADLPRHLVKQLFSYLVKHPSSTKRISDEPLCDDSKPRSYDVTFSNSLFDFNDDFTLCNDNSLFDEEFEDISSLDPPPLS
uniref:NAC domain-containing protein n=1 Tax=Tanacetum cinerariifolium TaxID=118510 RepID=A0A6L2N2T4_TANCI|nr:hypothetical protein [Tanacetum cinerariifolium]